MRLTALLISLSVLAAAPAGFPASGAGTSVVHPKFGSVTVRDSLTVTHVAQRQYFYNGPVSTRDKDIASPKSVHVHPSGRKFYVNSLEGCKTVVFSMGEDSLGVFGVEKAGCVEHKFSAKDTALWAEPSGLYMFQRKFKNPDTFSGKPVESTFTHNGRYLWVPYYRRSFDLNALEPSALSVIDTQRDSIVRVMETGPLPKMIATSPDGKYVAVTHWGDNTVGIIDVSSDDPAQWIHLRCITIDYKFDLSKFSESSKVDRDSVSGYALRGTVFTPDGRYLLVGCMGGGGIAVIDMEDLSYLGRIFGMMPNLRHLVIDGDWLYLSINKSGYVQRIRLADFLSHIPDIENHRYTIGEGWESCKVGAGARTICLTPDGRYVIAACNFASCLCFVDTSTMTEVLRVPVDSFPVGLDLSSDGRYVFVTSQGRSGAGGGNALNVFRISYPSMTRHYTVPTTYNENNKYYYGQTFQKNRADGLLGHFCNVG